MLPLPLCYARAGNARQACSNEAPNRHSSPGYKDKFDQGQVSSALIIYSVNSLHPWPLDTQLSIWPWFGQDMFWSPCSQEGWGSNWLLAILPCRVLRGEHVYINTRQSLIEDGYLLLLVIVWFSLSVHWNKSQPVFDHAMIMFSHFSTAAGLGYSGTCHPFI